MHVFTNVFIFTLLLKFVYAFQSEALEKNLKIIQIMNEDITAASNTVKKCLRDIKASIDDVRRLINHIPQTTKDGKCLVACVIEDTKFFKNNNINVDYILERNKHLFTEDNRLMEIMKSNIDGCISKVVGIRDFCENLSSFNDCVNGKSEQVVEIISNMEAADELMWDDAEWKKIEHDIVNNVKDEL